jgi:L-alanine-DL-glutamate epimerase-like enolase superfamily enzyme
MLGGKNPSVPLYASLGATLSVPERVETILTLKADRGFQAFKLRIQGISPKEGMDYIRAVRDGIGDETTILVDANQGWRMPYDTASPWDLKTAVWVADALFELNVYWLEEPLNRHDYRDLAALRKRSKVRIAGGEGNREVVELSAYLHHGSLDVYQPDAAWSTGIYQVRQIAEKVTSSGLMFTPHTWGDGIVLLANLHVAAALSNAPFTEFPYDPPYWTPERRDFMLPEPIRPDRSGKVSLSNAPGFGIDIDWQSLEEFRV